MPGIVEFCRRKPAHQQLLCNISTEKFQQQFFNEHVKQQQIKGGVREIRTVGQKSFFVFVCSTAGYG